MSASTSLTLTSFSMISQPSISLSLSRATARLIRSQPIILYPNGTHHINLPFILLINLILKSFLLSHLQKCTHPTKTKVKTKVKTKEQSAEAVQKQTGAWYEDGFHKICRGAYYTTSFLGFYPIELENNLKITMKMTQKE